MNYLKRSFTLLALFFPLILSANTYTVINTNDSGSGSLRQAIQNANSNPGNDTIVFNITGMAPHTISISSSLPSLTNAGTVIDGSTQPANGSTATGPRIVVSGNGFNNGHGLTISAANCELYGLFIRNMPYNGLVYTNSASGFILGAPGKGNVISGNSYRGIQVNGADNGIIQGNIIGMNETGTVALPNSYFGIAFETGADNHLIGGPGSGEGNVISSNLYDGVQIECSNNNVFQGNMIGVDINGQGNFGNNYSGISVESGGFFNPGCLGQNNIFGGLNPGEGNIIANNQYYGINISGLNVNYNQVRGNSIYCNNYDGMSLVDGNSGQPNGNNGFASPVIQTASTAGASGTATPNAIIDIYADDQCNNCEPKTFIGFTTANASGNWTYAGTLYGNVTAIAVDSSNGNTSDNGNCVFVSAAQPPSANFSASLTSICAGDCINFSDQSTGIPNNWSWSFPGAQTTSSTQQSPNGICYNTAGTYPVTLVVSNAVGADSLTQTAYITVSALPNAAAAGPASICLGDSATLNASGGQTYAWTPSNGLSNPNISNPNAAPGVTTTYTVTASVAGGCSDTANLTIVVEPLPNISTSTDQTICPGDTTEIFAVMTNGASGVWRPGNLVIDSIITVTNAFPTQTTQFIFTGYTGSGFTGCSASDTTTINVYPAPMTPMITQSGNVLTSTSALSYQWYLNGNPISGATNQTLTIPSDGNYTVVTTDANGCEAESTPFTTVHLEEWAGITEIQLWPNPNQGQFRLQFESQEHINLELVLYDVLGNELRKLEYAAVPGHNLVTIAEENLAEGIYLVRLGDESGARSIRFHVTGN